METKSIIIPSFDRAALVLKSMQAVPEAFDSQGRFLAPIAGRWESPRAWMTAASPIDGMPSLELPSFEADQATDAVVSAATEFPPWSLTPLEKRIERIAAGLSLLRQHRDLLVGLVAWEIGKTPQTAGHDVDRCISGAEWYLSEVPRMMEGRRPMGLVTNIASWNYPFSVLMLHVLVQTLVGNSVVAKIPTQGGGMSLTVAVALLRRIGLPITLIGGRGKDLTEPLVGHDAIAGLSFVGGRNGGDAVGRRLRGTQKRFALEMEGVNAYVITRFSNWDGLEKHIRGSFDFGKQRCTAYARWVVERNLVPRFIDTYIKAVQGMRVGHPLAASGVDFGPLISSAKVDELRGKLAHATAGGAEMLYQCQLAEDAFEPAQGRAAYFAPTLIRRVPHESELYLREPFGPVDQLIEVDSEDQLLAEANISDGALVGTVATDDPLAAERIGSRLRAFKVGINRLRSRGDREETFGGIGRSWRGAFVGGENLLRAFTYGAHPIHGNWE